jgi:hypothetical protein
MPQEDAFATRREFDMLASRVESIDRDGTRGVVAVQTQLTDTIKDIAELKLDMHGFKTTTTAWFSEHAKQHDEDVKQRVADREQDRRERTNSKRWIIGMFVAFLAALGGMYEFLNVILQHIK